MLDLGPSGFFNQDKVFSLSILNLLKEQGVSSDTLDKVLKEVVSNFIPDPD